MDRNKKSENTNGKKGNGETKIPKSTGASTAKEEISNQLATKKAVQSKKTSERTVDSAKVKTSQITNLPSNGKGMSIVKISKDLKNHLQTENLKSVDKENATKQVPLKEKCSQTLQKETRKLSKMPSGSDIKRPATFGGMKFTTKKSAFMKSDPFQEVKKILKKCEDQQSDIKADPTKSAESKEMQKSNDKNLENASIKEIESAKATVKKTTLRRSATFGGITFSPKWKSTPLKPDIFENMQKEFKHMELYPTVLNPKSLQIPETTKRITKVQTWQSNSKKVDVPLTQKPESSKNNIEKNVKEAISKPAASFKGLRFKPRQKKMYDIFEVPKTKTVNQVEK